MRAARAAGLALAAALLLALPAAAGAHATLEGTVPARGAVVAREPAQVVFRFDESVEGNFGAVRVFDAKGDRVDQGDAFHPSGRGDEMAVHLKPGLPQGSYTATYRVVSADSHIVSSGFVFSIGRAGAAPAQTVAQLTSGASSGADTTVFAVVRALQYGATALAGGALLFLLACWLPALHAATGPEARWRDAAAAFDARLRRLLGAAVVVGVLSAAAGIVVEGAEAAGISIGSALRPHVWREVIGTRFGTIWAIAAGAWLLLGVLWTALSRRRDRGLVLLAVPVVFLILVPSLSGHGTTQHPVAVLLPANVLHVAAMTAWLGGLVVLLAAVPAATRALEPAERTRLLSGALGRFSAIALAAVGVLLLSGLLQSYEEIRHLDLVFSTAFGRAAFIKLCLLLALIGLGALNRQRTLPRLRAAAAGGTSPGEAGIVLRRTLRAEVGLVVVVLVVTGFLAGYPPAIAAQSGPVNRTLRVGAEQLELTVDPARVGANQIHLYLFDAKTGAQFTAAKEVRADATLPDKAIGPLPLDVQKAGPGHYTVQGALLNAPGTWRIRVTVRTSAFDESQTTAKVPVR